MANVGRPTIYKPELIDKLEEYMLACKPRYDAETQSWAVKADHIPSIKGFRLWLCDNWGRVSKKLLNKWKTKDLQDIDCESEESQYYKFDQFMYMLDDLMDFQCVTAINGGASGRLNSNICKLVLSKHGYHDKSEVKVDATDKVSAFMGSLKGK